MQLSHKTVEFVSVLGLRQIVYRVCEVGCQ